MITIATTRHFLDTLFANSDKDEYHRDLNSFLKNEVFDVRLICDFESIDEFTEALIDNPFWELLMDKNNEVHFNPQLNSDLNDNDFYEKLSEENFFFSSLSLKACKLLSVTRGYIYISSEDISSSWKPIKFIRENSLLKVTNDANFPTNKKFDDWDKIDNYIVPSTAILIFDKYIFSDSTNQKLSDNLFKLLKKLCLNNKLLKPITLTIISEFANDKKVFEAYEKLETFFIHEKVYNVRFNVIKHDKSKYPLGFEGLHYRLILTNNLRIKCDDSFNFFKRNGRINNDADIHISLLMCRVRRCFYEKELGQIKQYISSLKNLAIENKFIDQIFYHPDKMNYLIN